VAVGLSLARPEDDGPAAVEPDVLGLSPVPDSFGWGPGVTWKRPDLKAFSFRVVSAGRVVGLLHYQARDVAAGAVIISLNGAVVGAVPADTANASSRELELVLPPQALRRDEPNRIVFDNVKNPPAQDPWRVWNLWLEFIPIPELKPEELMAQAREYVRRGQAFYDLQTVGSDNLFRAWKNYRSAWLMLTGLNDRPDLYDVAHAQVSLLGARLDQQCARMMLEFQRALQYKNRKKAKQTLEEVGRYFPTGEHRCHNLALQKVNEYEL